RHSELTTASLSISSPNAVKCPKIVRSGRGVHLLGSPPSFQYAMFSSTAKRTLPFLQPTGRIRNRPPQRGSVTGHTSPFPEPLRDRRACSPRTGTVPPQQSLRTFRHQRHGVVLAAPQSHAGTEE